MQLNDLKHPALTLSATLDGYRVEIDPARQRADIVLCRPPFNVISMTQREQLRITFEALDANDDVRVIVLRSEGEHFSSGGNIAGFLEASPEHVSKLAWNVAAPARCSKPVIAAARGYCFGVGFEISLACDFRLATPTTLYALPEQKLGQIPGSGGSARLQKMVGITRTKDIVMRSRRISGAQAYPMLRGFVSPELMFFQVSGNAVINVIVGGTGTLIGPLYGSAILTGLRSVVGSFTAHHHIVIGVMFVVVVIVMPRGLIGYPTPLLQRWLDRRQAPAKERP